jgi:hypothetical protein
MGTTRGAVLREKPGSGDLRTDGSGMQMCVGSGTIGEADDPELLEFLAGDLEPLAADPVFQQELGWTLWVIYRRECMSRTRRG